MHKLLFFTSLLFFLSCNNPQKDTPMETEAEIKFDWQGHRGARGLVPENTIPSFWKALEFDVTTLELDVAISKDGIVVCSHEPWMSHHISSKPDKSPVTEDEAMQLNLHQMTYEEIKQYDVGMRGNERFPQQRRMPVYKPSLSEMVQEVDKYCEKMGRVKPNFNIEMKCHPRGDSIFHPTPDKFAEILLAALKRLNIESRTCIQSFDPRAVMEVKVQAPNMVTAFLVENKEGISNNLAKLNYKPEIYSPEHILLTKASVDSLHQQGIKVIPWTVNEVKEMDALIKMGVDGIITDYPNLIEYAGKD